MTEIEQGAIFNIFLSSNTLHGQVMFLTADVVENIFFMAHYGVAVGEPSQGMVVGSSR